MTLKREKVKGNIIRDHLSMAFTSVRSGILILSWEERLRSRVFFRCVFLSRLRRPDSRVVLAFLYWRPELSNIVEEELWVSLRVVLTSFVPTSLWISRVVSKMFPWESAWAWRDKSHVKNGLQRLIAHVRVHEAASRQANGLQLWERERGLHNQVCCPKLKSFHTNHLQVVGGKLAASTYEHINHSHTCNKHVHSNITVTRRQMGWQMSYCVCN